MCLSDPPETDEAEPSVSKMSIGTATHFRWLNGIVKSVVVMNLPFVGRRATPMVCGFTSAVWNGILH